MKIVKAIAKRLHAANQHKYTNVPYKKEIIWFIEDKARLIGPAFSFGSIQRIYSDDPENYFKIDAIYDGDPLVTITVIGSLINGFNIKVNLRSGTLLCGETDNIKYIFREVLSSKI